MAMPKAFMLFYRGLKCPDAVGRVEMNDTEPEQERLAKQRVDLAERYQDCAGDVGGNPPKAAACKTHLKSAEMLR